MSGTTYRESRLARVRVPLPLVVAFGLLAQHETLRAAPTDSAAKSGGKPAVAALVFKIKGVRAGGMVRCGLFNSEKAFLKNPMGGAASAIDAKGVAICRFKGVRPGKYAVAVYHDQNNNQKIDTNWIGIPKEGTCTSNNVQARFGPPKWKDAMFVYRGGELEQALQMRYR